MGSRMWGADAKQYVVEEFCALIQTLREDGVEPIQARLFERLEISRSTVSETVAILDKEGYIAHRDHLDLTPEGLVVAERTLRRRRLAEVFLVEHLDLSFAACRRDAERWQHGISDDVEANMISVLGRPVVCPHGNPIPYKVRRDPARVPAEQVALSTVGVGAGAELVRVREELESTTGMLDYLDGAGLRPGARLTVETLSPDGTRTVAVGDQRAGLGPFVCGRLVVTVTS
ncbi:MAG: metal-dependent transcriptional regulator [Ilumatobacteraceae bacterium]